MKLERLVERAAAMALKRLQRDGEVCPGIMLHSGQRGTAVIALPWESPTQKELMLAAVSDTMELMEVEAYAIWSEVWMSAGTKDRPLAPDVPPSLDPKREDALVIVGAERGGETVARFWRVVKGEDGKVVRLDEDVRKPDHVVGRLATLLEAPQLDA